jgi:hypothetical protein
MSKGKDTNIFRHSSKGQSPWDAAIKDAEEMVNEAKKRIKILRSAIKGFEELKGAGHPWPGSDEAKALLGQDSDL